MDRCVGCGMEIDESSYRHNFNLFLPQEQHGDTLIIGERTLLAQIHPDCAMKLGIDLFENGQNMLNPAKSQEQFRTNLQGLFSTL